MKKILYRILLTLFIIFPFGVLAEGYITATPETLTIEKDSSESFTITAYNVIGDVSIKSNDSSVATVDTNEWQTGMVEEKTKQTGTIKVTGKNVGKTTITLTIDDAATYDEEDLSGKTQTITVNVVEKKNNSTPKNPSTGIMFGYGILFIIILIGFSVYLKIKRKSKFLKHN